MYRWWRPEIPAEEAVVVQISFFFDSLVQEFVKIFHWYVLSVARVSAKYKYKWNDCSNEKEKWCRQ